MAARAPGAWSQIDILTEEGRATRADVLAFVAANLDLHEAAIARGVLAEDAADDYRETVVTLMAVMREDGLTDAQIDELIGKYREPGRG